jgi:hypothetical protein
MVSNDIGNAGSENAYVDDMSMMVEFEKFPWVY